MVVSPGQYIPEKLCFDIPEHDARDKLLPKGHQFCKCDDYKLGKEGKGREEERERNAFLRDREG